jgi:hypothetical protein
MEAELAAEPLARRTTEDALAEALAAPQAAEQRSRDKMTVQEVRMPPRTPHGLGNVATSGRKAPASQDADAMPIARAVGVVEAQARRRGRPAKVGDQDALVIEWWKPGGSRSFGRAVAQSLNGGHSIVASLGKTR